ncbi:MAG TPA: hypothetical protein VHH11_05670 [Gammaproteobacteria bacterium]|nr:hypothetical protein [Gammaproteobacteria bacterium]
MTDSTRDRASTVRAAATPPSRGQRIAAFAFLAAFGLTILTVVLTGLWVRSPAARRAPDPEVVSLVPAEARTVNLLFESRVSLNDVRYTLELPPGIELRGRPGVRRVVWTAPLAAGNNVLPLELVALSGHGGQLAARLQHGAAQKTFVVDLAVGGVRR